MLVQGRSLLSIYQLTLLQPLPNGFPWGDKDSGNTNYYTDYPDTGVTRYYDWTVSKQTIAPDGVNVTGLLVNGQFPGPLIEANWGDSMRPALISSYHPTDIHS